MKPEMLINGFRTCGLYPFGPYSIDFSKCLGGTIDKRHNNRVGLLKTFKEALMSCQIFLKEYW